MSIVKLGIDLNKEISSYLNVKDIISLHTTSKILYTLLPSIPLTCTVNSTSMVKIPTFYRIVTLTLFMSIHILYILPDFRSTLSTLKLETATLSLWFNTINIDALPQCINLTSLNISPSLTLNNLEILAQCTKLAELTMRCSEDLFFLTQIPSLRKLDLSAYFSGPISTLPLLEELTLTQCIFLIVGIYPTLSSYI
jgi:hypothetical protein